MSTVYGNDYSQMTFSVIYEDRPFTDVNFFLQITRRENVVTFDDNDIAVWFLPPFQEFRISQ